MAFMAAAVPYLAAAATVVSTVGAISSAKAQSDAMNYNADLARKNATIADQQSAEAMRRNEQDTYRKLGALRAGYGASGVGTDGSPMDVLADSYTNAALDAENTKYQYKLKSIGYQNDANLDSANADNAMKSGYVNAASRALLGAAQTGQAYNNYSSSSSSGSTLPWQTTGNVKPQWMGGGYY